MPLGVVTDSISFERMTNRHPRVRAVTGISSPSRAGWTSTPGGNEISGHGTGSSEVTVTPTAYAPPPNT
jgi:hypothetical protein